jgi:hypothetical protein
MSFKTIRSESFAPMFRGLSLMAGIGSIAIVLAMNAAVSSRAATVPRPPLAASDTVKSPSRAISPARWTDWRWGSEDGVYYIEYNWQPRDKRYAAQ